MSYDPKLGLKVNEHLTRLGVETPVTYRSSVHDFELVKASFTDIMQDGLGLDMQDDSLQDTPSRVAKMYCSEIFTGLNYEQFPKCATFENKMKSNELIAIDKADVLSVCEHHFVPFVGYASVGYIPSTKLLGLSKMHRVVDFFSRRPQVQERLTLQIYHALSYILDTVDVAVMIKAEHMCVKLRGVKQPNSKTITSQMGGRFMEKPALREEFLNLVR